MTKASPIGLALIWGFVIAFAGALSVAFAHGDSNRFYLQKGMSF